MSKVFKKLISILTIRERWQLFSLLFAFIIMAVLEAMGVATIVPFMVVLGRPEVIHENRWLRLIYEVMGSPSSKSFLLFLGGVVLGALLIRNAYSMLITWYSQRLINAYHHGFSVSLLRKYLYKPYTYFLKANSAELAKNILDEISRVTDGLLMPFIQAAVSTTVAIFILLLLLFIDPWLALSITLVLFTGYALIIALSKKIVLRSSHDATLANKNRHTCATEALHGIREIKLLGKEEAFISRYSNWSRIYARSQAITSVIAQLPRYVMEAVAFGGVIVIILYWLVLKKDITQILPILSLYAYAGYRLMPALQNTFVGVTKVRYFMPSLEILYNDIKGRRADALNYSTSTPKVDQPLSLRNEIKLENIYYRYPGCTRPAIEQVSMTIKADTSIGLVGATGAGKTTLADIISGLLRPESGRVLVDGKEIGQSNICPWQRSIGYIPQHIYLADDTLRRNVAFGIPDTDIDQQAVTNALRIANLYDVASKELPDGLDTIIGERGIRLSGGQRQRVGLARALYHLPRVLILDEATSAVDGITEGVIMDALVALDNKKTIIVIAHRLTTVRECDLIYMIDDGRIVDKGTYNQLFESNEQFRAMAQQETVV